MLSFRSLEIFETVAKTGNFTKAAQELYITQSAVSHAIQELEGMTKTPLFDRRPRGVKLTPAGRLLLTEAVPILSSCSVLKERLLHLEEAAPVRIVSSITIAAFRLPRVLKKFELRWPKVPVRVEVVRAAEAVKKLKEGSADLALLEGAAPKGRFHVKVFDDHPLRIVCAPDYGISGSAVSVDEFCAQKLLLREKGSAIRDTLDSRLFLLGRSVEPVWTSVNSTALIEAAKAGLGITVLPEVLVQKELAANSLAAIQVEEFQLGNEMLAAWPEGQYLTPPVKELISMLLMQTGETHGKAICQRIP